MRHQSRSSPQGLKPPHGDEFSAGTKVPAYLSFALRREGEKIPFGNDRKKSKSKSNGKNIGNRRSFDFAQDDKYNVNKYK